MVRRWQSQGKKKTPVKSGPPVSFENIPSGGLYILIPDNTRGQERPFTIENGARRHW